jgi:hypothetical protein
MEVIHSQILSKRLPDIILHQLFCDADDFCNQYLPDWHRTRLQKGDRKRRRREIIPLVVYYPMSGYRTFKWFYVKYLLVYGRQKFPRLPSDNRFVELTREILEPLTAFMQSRCGKSVGIAFVDSILCVCENIRILRHKTFAENAGRSKSSTGWFYGFKLHFTVNDCGDILSFCLTRGNVDDRVRPPCLIWLSS